eukprot:5422479-Pyramimonas_sp.AAC.1
MVLGLRSTSYKIITASANYAIRKPLDAVVPPSQRGFMRGRNFAMNIAEVDAVARAYSCRPGADE